MTVGHAMDMKIYIHMLVHASGYMKTMHVEMFISTAFVFKIYGLMKDMTRLLILVYELL